MFCITENLFFFYSFNGQFILFLTPRRSPSASSKMFWRLLLIEPSPRRSYRSFKHDGPSMPRSQRTVVDFIAFKIIICVTPWSKTSPSGVAANVWTSVLSHPAAPPNLCVAKKFHHQIAIHSPMDHSILLCCSGYAVKYSETLITCKK